MLKIINNWSIFSDEKQFNKWINNKGARFLRDELKTLLGLNYKRISVKNCFGFPDHNYYSSKRKRLLIIECADVLTKRHLSKDMLYVAAPINNISIHSKAIFWILKTPPTTDIIEKIRVIHDDVMIGNCPIYYYLSSIVSVTDTSLRLNLEESFGEKITRMNDRTLSAYCYGRESWISMKSFGNALGFPNSTSFNVAKRWGVKRVANKISLSSVRAMINKIEEKASSEAGVDFRNKFIPAHKLTDQMLFGAKLNRMLGYKGMAVRVPIKPKYVTISGSGPRGYRLVFDIADVKAFQKSRELKLPIINTDNGRV